MPRLLHIDAQVAFLPFQCLKEHSQFEGQCYALLNLILCGRLSVESYQSL